MFMGLGDVVNGVVVSDSPNGPQAVCDTGQVWSDFYGSCVDSCGPSMGFDANGICKPIGSGGNTPGNSSSSGGNGSSQPWWSTALSALTTGVVSSQLPKPPAPKPVTPAATPWYMTPLGIVAIVLGIGGGAYFLAKK